jgi:hypothetical protein
MPVIGHAIRATDRAMDFLHGSTNADPLDLLGRRWRVWLPAYGHGFDADGTATRPARATGAGPPSRRVAW